MYYATTPHKTQERPSLTKQKIDKPQPEPADCMANNSYFDTMHPL
ncbi:hypothetical protein [uncultured Allofournierella sp.]